jgi:hypothetical protein
MRWKRTNKKVLKERRQIEVSLKRQKENDKIEYQNNEIILKFNKVLKEVMNKVDEKIYRINKVK